MKWNLLSILFLFGGLQALILMVGINLRHTLRSDLQKLVSLLLMTFVISMSFYLMYDQEMGWFLQYTYPVGSAAWMAICPTYYLLSKKLTAPDWKLSVSEVWLYSVSILFLLDGYVNMVFPTVSTFSLLSDYISYLDQWFVLFFMSSIVSLLGAIKNFYNKEINAFYNHLRYTSYVLLVILVGFAIFFLVIRDTYALWFEQCLIGVLELVVFIFIFQVFRSSPMYQLQHIGKYHNHQKSTQDLNILAIKLESHLDSTKLFVNPKLSLSMLASEIDTTTTELSQLFTEHYKSNFYNYINNYRIEALVQKLKEPESQQYKIMALAQSCGFGSQTTFYKVFKERYQMTPREYIRTGGEG